MADKAAGWAVAGGVWVAGWAALDVAAGLGFLLRGDVTAADGAAEGARFGGSTTDMCVWAFARAAFLVGSVLLLRARAGCAGGRRRAPRRRDAAARSCHLETVLAVLTVLGCLAFWSYIVAKSMVRLVDDGPWLPTKWWFWTCLVTGCTLSSIETVSMIAFLRVALVQRLDRQDGVGIASPRNNASSAALGDRLLDAEEGAGIGAATPMTPNALRRKEKRDEEARRLFGSTFDWIYGKIEGHEDDDDVEEDDEKNKKKKKKKNAGGDSDEEDLDKMSRSASITELARMCVPDWPLLLAAASSLVVAAIGQSVIPYLTGQIINTVSNNPDKEVLERATLKLLGAAFVTAVFTSLRGSLFTVAMGKLNIRVRERLLRSLLSQDIAFFDKTKSGKLASRLNSDTTTLADQISLNLNVFLRSFVQAIGVLVFMFRINTELSLATFVTVPAVALVTKVYGDIVWHLYDEAQKRLANANAVSDAALTTMHNVRCFASETAELERYKGKMHLYYILQIRMAVLYSAYCIIFTLLPCLATGLVLFYGGRLVIDQKIQAGDLVSFMLYQQSLSDAINSIGSIFSGIAGALGAADKVFELINRRPREAKKGGARPEEFEGTVEFKNVTFRYPARPDSLVLDNISLKIAPGEIVALVGASGGGKSSVLKLLERLYDPNDGEILLSGIPLQDYDHEYLHERICIVGQEPVLYARSIAQNIMYGLEGSVDEPTMEQIIEAAKAANAHDFIMGFEDGYETKCGDRGVTLSGGQKQRIAIARALVRSGDILLLDEATSALDAESESLVQQTLDKIMATGKRTCIVVAHRLSTVRNADRIVAMKAGKIVETGTHDELVADTSSMYYNLVQKQLAH